MLVSFVVNQSVASEKSFSKSYYGSILSGQIANYNNDATLSADFFNYANGINPTNNNVYNLALMSLVMSGRVNAAIEKVILYQKNYGKEFNDSIIANFLIFINKVKKNETNIALAHLNEKKDFLITEKMKPILKAWLSDNLDQATESIEKYEYKSEGLSLSNIYFHHLGLIQYYHTKKNLSKKTFEEHLEIFDLED